MPHSPVQRHDRLAGTGRSRNANWPQERAINNAALAGMEECLTLSGGTKIGMLTYADIGDKAAALIYTAIAREAGDRGAPIVKAVLDPFKGRRTSYYHS